MLTPQTETGLSAGDGWEDRAMETGGHNDGDETTGK